MKYSLNPSERFCTEGRCIKHVGGIGNLPQDLRSPNMKDINMSNPDKRYTGIIL